MCVDRQARYRTITRRTYQLVQTEDMPRGGRAGRQTCVLISHNVHRGLPNHLASGLSTQLQLASVISSFYLLGGVLISEISCCRICMELKTCRLCGFKVDPLKILSGVCQHPKSLLYTKTAILTASTRQQMQVAVER